MRRDPDRVMPPWYHPVPKGHWWTLGANAFMLLFNLAMFAATDNVINLAAAAVSTVGSIWFLGVILRWREQFPPEWSPPGWLTKDE